MDQDLKLIKKKYGENMAKLCRSLFPTLLETKGLLPKLLIDNFEPNRGLYQDLVDQEIEIEFKNYIYGLVNIENKDEIKTNKTPKELLREAGYDLYECETEEEIQQFKKYYALGEELCTFRGGRLNRCRVFFAIKKDADKIKRAEYPNPKRQDEYGTSVISIQFTNDPTHTLSIKNRYNHKVNNPDSTFSNNLDNIIEGLTESFEDEYGLIQKHKNDNFELGGYVKASDGKFYKYNREINNIYYCPNNIIIDNFEVKRYEKEKYIVMDYFILDLVNKKIKLYDEKITDAFLDTIGNIEKIEIEKKKLEKQLIIKVKNREDIKIILNEDNEIIRLTNPNVERVGNQFLYLNTALQELNLPNLQKIGDYFLRWNRALKELDLPSVQKIGNGFLRNDGYLQEVNLPNLQKVGNEFLHLNVYLKKLTLQNLKEVGDGFLAGNRLLQEITIPNLEKTGDDFLSSNETLLELSLPNLQQVGYSFLRWNRDLKKLNLPKLKEVGDSFLYSNYSLQSLYLPSLQKVKKSFLFLNCYLQELNLPNLKKVGDNFLYFNDSLQELNLPNLQKISDNFLYCNTSLKKVNLPNLSTAGKVYLATYTYPIFNETNFKDNNTKISLNKVLRKIK